MDDSDCGGTACEPARWSRTTASAYRSIAITPSARVLVRSVAPMLVNPQPPPAASAIAVSPIRSADDWVQSHLTEIRRHAGEWLAVAAEGIVAAGATLADVRRTSLALGFGREQVVVFKVPVRNLKRAVGTKKP